MIKQYSWKIFKLIVRPLSWLELPRKKRKQNSQNCHSSDNLQLENDCSTESGLDSSSSLNIDLNIKLLEEEGIFYDYIEAEVLDRPQCEVKVAIALFKLRGGFETITNPEGWIRVCLRRRWWEDARNYYLLSLEYGHLRTWEEFFPGEFSTE